MSISSRPAIFGSIAVSAVFVMELTLVPLLLPAIQRQFDLTIGQLAWVFNAYGVAVAIGVLSGGWLGDALHVKRVFAVGVLLFALGSAIVALAGSYPVIIGGRIVQGFGGGVFSPLIPLLLTRLSPRRPGKILILWGSVSGYVAAFAPFLYGTTLANHSWEFAFYIFAGAAVIALAIVQAAPTRKASEKPANGKRNVIAMLGSRGLMITFGYVFFTYGAITYYLFRLPLWLSHSDYAVASIGVALSTTWLSFSLMSTALRNSVDKPHLSTILLLAPVLIGVGFPLAFLGNSFFVLIVSTVLVGSGLACSNAPSTQLVLKFAPKGISAFSASMDITFARLGGVVTVALLAQSMIGYALFTVTLMSMCALFCAFGLGRILNGKK